MGRFKLGAAAKAIIHASALCAGDIPGRIGRGPVPPWGLHMIVGDQGSGKTLFLTAQLRALRAQFGDRIAVATNYAWMGEDYAINGPDAIKALVRRERRPLIIAVDEIAAWWDCSQRQLVGGQQMVSLMAQQRKRRLCLMSTVQRYGRVNIVIREQARYVWTPSLTLGGRLLVADRYRASRYAYYWDTSNGGHVTRKKRQELLGRPRQTEVLAVTDELRDDYDTWRIIESLMAADDEAEERAAEDAALDGEIPRYRAWVRKQQRSPGRKKKSSAAKTEEGAQ